MQGSSASPGWILHPSRDPLCCESLALIASTHATAMNPLFNSQAFTDGRDI